MNRIKTLGLMIVATAALMAIVGAGSAAATETALCSEKTTIGVLPICEGPHLYAAKSNLHAELETFLLLETPIGNVECQESTIAAQTEQATAKPLGATVTALTFAKCERGAEPISITTLKNGTLDIEIIDQPTWTHNGTLELTGTELKALLPGLGIECRYQPNHFGTLTGGATGTIDLSGTWPRTGGSFLCGASVKAIAFYKVTSPKPLWVSM